MIKDKACTLQVLAGLIRNPLLLMDEHYQLTLDDFPEPFHRGLFAAINNLARSGAKQLDEIVIDEYLSRFPKQHQIFESNRGMEYIQQALAMSKEENFEYAYTRLKKCSLLSSLEQQGFDISAWYNPDELHVDEIQATRARLDAASLQDIIDDYELKLANIRQDFRAGAAVTSIQAGEGLRALVAKFKEAPDWGLAMNDTRLNTVCRGRRPSTLYLRSATSGTGKSRYAMAEACYVSIPTIYDSRQKAWVSTGQSVPTVYITTELTPQETQTMLLAYVAEIPEHHIKDGNLTAEEDQRLERAYEIIEQAPLYIEHLPEFNADDVVNVIKRNVLQHQIKTVFHDYIFISSSLLMEMGQKAGRVNVREDMVLATFADKLKALANELNIHIDTSTQVSGDWKNTNSVDNSLIRGCKSLSDRCDIALIMLPPTPKDKEAIGQILTSNARLGYMPECNIVLTIYKVRSGRWTNIKLFEFFDRSTLRITSLFATDSDYKLLDIQPTTIEKVIDQVEVPEEHYFAPAALPEAEPVIEPIIPVPPPSSPWLDF